MKKYKKYPVLEVNLEAITNNAKTVCEFCGQRGINVAGVIKFSDGDMEIVKAYHEGGCSEIASSRTVQLKRIKQKMPEITTLLVRIPMHSEVADVVKYCDISLNSEESTLRKLNAAAKKRGVNHGVILMYDVAERREGIVDQDKLCEMALLVEKELENLTLKGIGTSFACVSGVLPDPDNLRLLVSGARRIEGLIGRKLDIVSGGSSIDMKLLAGGIELPEGINHLRIGGFIANPRTMREVRGVVLPGMCEDTFTLTAEIVEIQDKPSPVGTSGKNWAGQTIEVEDKGIRRRAILAIGSQDISSAATLSPVDEGISFIGNSSDHTLLDITDSPKDWKVGDVMTFTVYYMNLLYSFATEHVNIKYINK
ncbi:MAG: alanine racemase [Firmicutes bacterium]|nr:alanine racemase [Bacillota bacterium]